MAAEGHEGAAVVVVGRIVRRPAVRIDDGGHGQLLAAGDRDAELAFGQLGRREVDEDRLAARAGNGPGDGVRAEGAHPRAGRGDRRIGVAERVADEPGGGDRLDVLADAPEMPTSIDHDDADAVGARQAHGGLRRQLRSELAPAAPAVDPSHGAALEYDCGLGCRIHFAALGELDIGRQAQHAVRVVTGDVGLDERPRDHFRALRRRAGRGENRRGEDDEIGCWEEKIVKHQSLRNG